MSIARTNPHQRSQLPTLRVADEPTSATPPSTRDQEPPARAHTGGRAAAGRAAPPGDAGALESVSELSSHATGAGLGSSARPFYRREPGLATMLAAFAVGVSAFLVPGALQRAAVIAAVGLLVVGIALLIFLPATTAVGTTTRPLYRREPWLAAMYAAFSLGLSVAVVPAALQRVVMVGAMSLLVVGVLLLVRQRPDSGKEAQPRLSDDTPEVGDGNRP